MDWQMFNPYGSHHSGAYASSGQPSRPINYPPQQYPQYGYPQPQTMTPQQPPPQIQYFNPPMVVVPQRPPEYLNQFQDFPDHHQPIQPMQLQAQPRPQQKHPRPQQRAPQHAHMSSLPMSDTIKVSPRPIAQPPKPAVPPVDLQVLLLSLADEYIAAARSLGPMVVLAKQEQKLQEYYKLMATGMGCLDAILRVRKSFTFPV